MLKHRVKTFFKRGKLFNIITSSKKKLFITSLILFIICISIFMPKGILKKSYKKILALAGVYTEEVKSVTLNGNYSTPGGFKIEKSAKWIGNNKAEITLDLKTKVKNSNDHKKDVILIIDNSGSMNGVKLDQVKSDSKELVYSLLSYTYNKVSVISFNSTATLLTGFSNNIATVNDIIDGITTTGGTNYNSAFIQLDSLLSSYSERDNTDLIALFLTDGYPGEDTPAEVGTYSILKDKYPYLEVVGIQYEMGSTLKDQIVRVSDRQFISDMDSLNNGLVSAVLKPKVYEELSIDDYIDNSYFQVDSINDISTSNGDVSLNNNKVSWDLSGLATGSTETMKIVVSLKNGVSSDYYPLNSSLTSTYKIENETEATSSTTDTPVLKDSYTVNYFANAPSGCSIANPISESHKAYSNVTKRSDELSCNGYLFKGYEIDGDVNYINDEVFIMPDHNVNIKGTWTKQGITKTMDGTIHRTARLYNVLKEEAENNGLARKYTGSHQDSFTEQPSRDIYHWYAANNTAGTQVLDKNNVIFAGHCWQMIRTTDTGGVKMIYNGEADDGKCLNTRGTHVGYAPRTSTSLASQYWYGTDYIYDSTAKTFKVSGTTEQTTWNATTGPSLIGKYTCKNTSIDGTCSTLYLVESYYSTSSAYVIPLYSNSNYSQFGTLQFNAKNNSPAYVGYMYNNVYSYNSSTMSIRETVLDNSSLSTSYWYADSVTWGNPTAAKYNLNNPYQVSSATDYPNLVGKYTFKNSSQTYTNGTVYYIVDVNGSSMHYFNLSASGNHTLSDYNYTYTYGDSYTDNGNGTYTINNPITIYRSDWYSSYNNIGVGKYVCKNAVNDTCSDLRYITKISNLSMTYISVSNNYKYAKGYSWDGTKYTLDNNSVQFFEWNNTNITSLNNAHYTCFNETGECTSLSYIYYIDDDKPYYINLNNGKSVDDALNEMLNDNGLNVINSTIKSGIEAWYKHYLLDDYDNYIEDTIFCNDRSISALNGWTPTGSNTAGSLQFKEYNTSSDLSCLNITDRFSVSNSNAHTTYKVGLVSSPEMNLLNNNYARNTGQPYKLGSPYEFQNYNTIFTIVDSNGSIVTDYVDYNRGVRPAISLIPGIEYIDGDGSMTNPYIVDTSGN